MLEVRLCHRIELGIDQSLTVGSGLLIDDRENRRILRRHDTGAAGRLPNRSSWHPVASNQTRIEALPEARGRKEFARDLRWFVQVFEIVVDVEIAAEISATQNQVRDHAVAARDSGNPLLPGWLRKDLARSASARPLRIEEANIRLSDELPNFLFGVRIGAGVVAVVVIAGHVL